MATIKFKNGDDYALRLSALGARSGSIAKKAIYVAAGITADRIRENLRSVVSDKSTGALVEALGVTPMGESSTGDWSVKIGFDGYDAKGTPNQLKARAMESGTSIQPKRPFVRPAVTASRGPALAAMKAVIDEETRKIMDR